MNILDPSAAFEMPINKSSKSGLPVWESSNKNPSTLRPSPLDMCTKCTQSGNLRPLIVCSLP
jgi:hypothetical protein